MLKFYQWLLKLTKPFVEWSASIHFAHYRKINGKHYYQWRDQIEVGDVLLTKQKYELTNFFNPADFKHSAIYVGGADIKYVVEATGDGVIRTDLVTFLTSKDEVLIFRPTFLQQDRLRMVATNALRKIGQGYDYMFEDGNGYYYCFELVVDSFRMECPEIRFKKIEVVPSKFAYTDVTFIEDTELWTNIIDSRNGI